MIESPNNLKWIDRLSEPAKSQMVFIRHGESDYTDEGLDITDKGIEQVRETAKTLKNYLQRFDCIMVLSSTTPRAMGSAKVFMSEMGQLDITKTSKSIRCVDIKQADKFLSYLANHSTPFYGETWLVDPIIAGENNFVESKHSVDKRAVRFLYHYGREIDRISKSQSVKIGVVVFTHFEIGMNYLHGIYPDHKQFPIREHPGFENAEAIIIELDDPVHDQYTIHARGISSTVVYNSINKSFSKDNGTQNSKN